MSADTTGVLQFATGATPTTAVTIDTSQNVGIGTTSPIDTIGYGRALDIQSNTGAAVYLRDSDNPTTQYGFVSFDGNAAINNLNIANNSSTGPIRFITNDTERMRIASTGDIVFGKTALDTTNPGIWFETTSINYGRFNFIKGTASGTGATSTLAFYYNGSQIGSIQNTSTATSYVTSSDYRLKENIAPMTGALDKVAQLKPVTYKWKVDGADGQGFIAHELQAIVPDCVTGEKDAVDEEGNIKPQGIDTSFLVATLTAAIQEQQTIINDLKARVTALENI
jgi:hypothetical protein